MAFSFLPPVSIDQRNSSSSKSVQRNRFDLSVSMRSAWGSGILIIKWANKIGLAVGGVNTRPVRRIGSCPVRDHSGSFKPLPLAAALILIATTVILHSLLGFRDENTGGNPPGYGNESLPKYSDTTKLLNSETDKAELNNTDRNSKDYSDFLHASESGAGDNNKQGKSRGGYKYAKSVTHKGMTALTNYPSEPVLTNSISLPPPRLESPESITVGGQEANSSNDQSDTPQDRSSDEHWNGTHFIAGIVLDQAGEPVSGIWLTARCVHLFDRRVAASLPESERERSVRTGYDGFYEFSRLYDGEYRVYTRATDRYASAGITTRAGVESADLVIVERERLLSVYGTVSDSEGVPLEGVRVMPVGQMAAMTYSDSLGGYRMDLEINRDTERYSIQFQHEDHRITYLQLDSSDYRKLNEVSLDATLHPLADVALISGQVTNNTGIPVAGERIKLFSRDQGRTYTAVTDSNGGFSMAGVASSDDYWIEVRPASLYKDYKRTNLRVGTGGLYLQVVLHPLGTGTLVGRMIDANGMPIPNFSLLVSSRDAVRQPLQLTSDEQGYFELESVPAGRLIFETRSLPYFAIKGVYLPAGEERVVELILDWGDHELYGRVLNSRGWPLAGSDIYLTWNLREGDINSISSRRVNADSEGYFLFTRLGPGLHRVTVDNVPGLEKFRTEHEVGAGDSEVWVQLRE